MAAGQGFKTFATGDVLSASDVNGYLMQGVLVFADATERNAEITSPQEGQFAYLKDTNVTTYYTGSAWANLDTTGMTNPMTTIGDTIYSSSGSTPARLGIGSTGQVLTVSGGVPSWASPASSSPSFVGCSIYNTSSFSVSNNTATRITCNSEFFDTNGFHDNSTNNARITIPTGYAGKYLVCMRGTYDAGSTAGYRSVTVYKNNASLVELSFNNAGSNNQTTGNSVIINLAVGDYIEMFTQQNSGTTLTMYAREYEHPIQVQWLGA